MADCPQFISTADFGQPRPSQHSPRRQPRTVRQCTVNACHACRDLAPRTPPGPHTSARLSQSPEHLLLTLSLPFTQTLSLSLSLPKPWRSSLSFPTIEALPRRSFAGGHRRTTPTSCTTSTSSSSLGRSFPNKLLPVLHSLPQA